MADSHPYISGPGNLAKMISQLRKSFPQTVTSGTVKKLGLASKNESYVINALQFIGIIDDDGKKTDAGASVFTKHKDDEFAKAFSKLVAKSYSGLFELHGDGSWELRDDDLITFFRTSDQTSDAIGKRQANTFKVFAAISGHGVIKQSKTGTKETKAKKAAVPKKKKPSVEVVNSPNPTIAKDIGLTVRVEINLPADGSKETYDNIFKSIKENLIDG